MNRAPKQAFTLPATITITNPQIVESMRSTLLQLQHILAYLDESIHQQDKYVERQIRDRLMQLFALHQRHTEIEVSNTVKTLTLHLEEVLALQEPLLEKVWECLDGFVAHLKALKGVVSNFCRKVYLGRNIGMDVAKLNVLVKKTKVYLVELMQDYGDTISDLSAERDIVNQIFKEMETYCWELDGLVGLVEREYQPYICRRIERQREQTQLEISEFVKDLMY